MTMSIIKPNVLPVSALSSTTAVDEYAAYNASTAYALNANVTYLERYWQCIQGPSTGNTPDESPLYWVDMGQSNVWGMFDTSVGTLTTAEGDLTVVLRPGAVGGIAMLELAGKSLTVTMRDAPGGTVIYNKTVALDSTPVTNFYDWFYAEYVQLTDVVLTDLPIHFVSNELTITISGASDISTVSCGVCQMGQVISVGLTQIGATVGIVDYSKKTVNAFGNYTIERRAFSKRSDFQVVLNKSDFNRVFRALADLRSTLCVYVGEGAVGYEPLLVWGFYKDFSMDVAYTNTLLCNFSIEGLI
jgi:hypothetical protein